MRSNLTIAAACAGLVTFPLLSSCGSSEAAPQQTQAAAAAGSSSASNSSSEAPTAASDDSTPSSDVTHTNLPDTNYDSQGWLEARKRGLAKESAEDADPSKTGTVDPHAYDPYTRADYPDVVRQWGKLIPTINRERKLAATIAAKDPRCDGVDNAQLTDHGSRINRHYMVECNNITRLYFDAKSLAEHRPALVRTEADMGAQGILNW